jgi:hypothetical protein
MRLRIRRKRARVKREGEPIRRDGATDPMTIEDELDGR